MCRPMMYRWLTATSEVMVCFDSITLVNPEFAVFLHTGAGVSITSSSMLTESEECQALSPSLQTDYGKFLQVKGKVELSVSFLDSNSFVEYLHTYYVLYVVVRSIIGIYFLKRVGMEANHNLTSTSLHTLDLFTTA